MKQRTEGKTSPTKTVTVNVLSNLKISIDSKSILTIVFSAIVLVALVVSGSNSETLQEIRSLIEAWVKS